MRAVTIPEYGGPEVLAWQEVPDPQPGPGEVLVDVHASAVNRADLLQRQGHYPPPPGAPPYPGLECAGVVAEVGPPGETPAAGGAPAETPAAGDPPAKNATPAEFTPGDPVCALLAGGGYAERVAVPAGQVLPVPAGVDLVEAAALPEVACTVWANVCDLARLRPGETLLVHGGGSGIGTFAVQLGAALGARVLATARAEKHAAVRALGAEAVFDYTEVDFVEEVRRHTDGRGADVVLDIVGAKYLARNVDVLAPDGRLTIIGLLGGRRAEIDLAALLRTRGVVSATSLRGRPLADKARIVQGVRDQVWPLVKAGRVRPVVDRRLPMSEAAQAHRVVADSAHVGKVLLTVPGRA